MTTELEQFIQASTAASRITDSQILQSLWSGYGQIIRFSLDQPGLPSVIVKCIDPPERQSHPRGWDTNVSVQRKLRSYRVETHWYNHYAQACPGQCTVPHLLASKASGSTIWLVLEDLDLRYPLRHENLVPDDCIPCLQWLACFHAHHFQSSAEGLWQTGTYWHLSTRQEEYAAMRAGALKDAAWKLDNKLEECHYKTLVHGDAKVANFCFSRDNRAVAMVDFQYVGAGCGIRDVAYFLGSCLDERECETHSERLLKVYFDTLTKHLPAPHAELVEEEWRDLYPIAWADFHRFLAGWMPQHKKINRYTEQMTKLALGRLSGN